MPAKNTRKITVRMSFLFFHVAELGDRIDKDKAIISGKAIFFIAAISIFCFFSARIRTVMAQDLW